MNSLEYKYINGYNNKYYITKEGKVYISNYRPNSYLEYIYKLIKDNTVLNSCNNRQLSV